VSRPRLLDLFSCQGGAGVGYHRAGFDVTGVDLDRTNGRYYPFEFHHADALEYVTEHWRDFDAVHASPPCQAMTRGNAGRITRHVNLIPDTRAALEATGLPYVIENVEDAGKHMRSPELLCGSMFGLATEDEDGEPLRLERHRLFETNWGYRAPAEHAHDPSVRVAGVYNGARARQPGQTAAEHRYTCQHVRKGGYVPRDHGVKRRLLGVDWPTTVKALTECIPPAYAHHVGTQLQARLT